MIFNTSSSYTLPKLYAEDRCQTPSLLTADTLSARDEQIKLYCQTIIGLTHDLVHCKSLKSVTRLQRRIQRVLDIETQIDLTKNETRGHFERNLHLFICVVDHRLRSIAVDSPDRYHSIVDKLQLILIESDSTHSDSTLALKISKKALGMFLHSS